MAQVPLREYDVKKMYAKYSHTEYHWVQIRDISDIKKLENHKRYIIKPDMLFGKRGKRGMLWVNLSPEEVETWLKKWYKKEVNIDGVAGTLDVFLAEEIIDIKREYYVSFSQSRDGDIITFSPHGWVDIEENWETTKSIISPVSEDLTNNSLNSLLAGEIKSELLSSLFNFYKTHGFTSLEFNPIAEDATWKFHLIDAVAKIDDCEHFLQKDNWSDIEFPQSFWWKESKPERYIRKLDMQTGASLKFKILNPNAAIWTLFAGGGGSLVLTDTLWALGYISQIGNYWELSGNPSREYTREYTRVLLEVMLKAKSQHKKYLIIAGAIANFTDIATTFQGIIDILEELQDELRKQEITILVRRGGIREKVWLELLKKACEKLHISAHITGSESYMTDILQKIKL